MVDAIVGEFFILNGRKMIIKDKNIVNIRGYIKDSDGFYEIINTDDTHIEFRYATS